MLFKDLGHSPHAFSKMFRSKVLPALVAFVTGVALFSVGAVAVASEQPHSDSEVRSAPLSSNEEGAAAVQAVQAGPAVVCDIEESNLLDVCGVDTNIPLVEPIIPVLGADLNDGMRNVSTKGDLDDRSVRAFPGAYGPGQNVTGGRGGQVLTVNTLSCDAKKGDGKMSIREALEGTGDAPSSARIVVFSVGGQFNCGDDGVIQIENGDLSVYGQTAPAPGVNLSALQLTVKHTNNVLLQSFQILGSDPSGKAMPTSPSGSSSSGRGVSATATESDTHDLFYSNIASINQTDDNHLFTPKNAKGEIYNVTLQETISAEADGCSSHHESWCVLDRKSSEYNHRKASYYHAMGMGFNSTTKGSIHDVGMLGNYMAHNGFRNPIMRGVTQFEIGGNMTYNAVKKGFDFWGGSSDGYVFDNAVKRGPNSDGDGWGVTGKNIKSFRNELVTEKGVSKDAPTLQGSPNGFKPTVERWQYDADCVGPAHRDANLARIFNEGQNGTGEAGIGSFGDPLISDGDGGRHWKNDKGYYESTSHPVNFDTDNDGMGDAWETANGLVVGKKDAGADLDGDGYLNVEEYASWSLRSPLIARGCAA